MEKTNKKNFYIALCALLAFVFWTVAVKFIDVKAIGPYKTEVGFATFNGFVHTLTGVNMTFYNITDWLGIVPLVFAIGFGILGLVQLIKRKSLLKVDSSIIILGALYIVVIVIYILFEEIVINYRPILINGCLEVSYPSSTTILTMCIMLTSAMQLKTRIKSEKLARAVTLIIVVFVLFMVLGRIISGVHWITDIIGGALFSAAMVKLYSTVVNFWQYE